MILKRRKKEDEKPFCSTILDVQDIDIVVARGKECEVLFMNTAAKERTKSLKKEEALCDKRFSACFPGLCEFCEKEDMVTAGLEKAFDIKDLNGKVHSVKVSEVEWIDGKMAKVLFVHNVDEQRALEKRLYSLAYLDHLTHVPNRQKLKEDFDALVDGISDLKTLGAVAIFDLDNFKSVNDTYGHNTGDVMLKRLTEHLQSDPAFKGHLYRLGGDEFVLLYSEGKKAFASEQELQKHYDKLLSGALRAYSMPNIEIACTISMGVSCFPLHGDNFSELLRKADIALYKAKAEGRNRLVFFEDRYDKAKKFKDLYISIQPILNGEGQTFGYELLDRGNENDEGEEKVNLLGSDRALDALGVGDLENYAKYFIAYSSQLTNMSVLKNLPKDKFVIQVPVDRAMDDQEIARYQELRSHGYSLALVGLTREHNCPGLLPFGSYCKFDGADKDFAWQQRFIAENQDKKFIASNIDTAYSLENAKIQGYSFFQGFFFSEQAVVKKTKDISPMKVNYYRLLQLTSTDDYVNFKEIGDVISSDVAMSYKLLRMLNSAALGLRNQVSSIEMAVAYLGEENLKKWIAMLALRGIAAGKPLELVRISLIRARFAELLAPFYKPPRQEKHVFLIGMFSLLHIALEKSQQELFEEIPVADDIKYSLMGKEGAYSDLIPFFTNYEYANWDEVSRYAEEHQMSDTLINDSYIAAVRWYNDIAQT